MQECHDYRAAAGKLLPPTISQGHLQTYPDRYYICRKETPETALFHHHDLIARAFGFAYSANAILPQIYRKLDSSDYQEHCSHDVGAE
jgi:hypothetical protein